MSVSHTGDSEEYKSSTKTRGCSLRVDKSILAYAEYYTCIGLSVIPLRPQSKEPATPWKDYQSRIASEEELREWFSKGDNNIAIVTGSVSGNLVVIDFDNEEAFRKFYNSLDEMGLHHLRDKILSTWIVETGKGIHVYFRVDAPPEVFVKIFRTKVRVVQYIDIKAEGGYVVAPPSTHPSGKQYRFRLGPAQGVLEPAKLSLKEWRDLLRALGVEVEAEAEAEAKAGAEAGAEPEAVHRLQELQKRRLSDEQVRRIVDTLKPFYIEGYRNQILYPLIGALIKDGVDYDSVYRVVELLATETNDEEKDERLYLVNYHFKQRIREKGLENLTGYSGLSQVLTEILRGQGVAEDEIPKIVGDVITELHNIIRQRESITRAVDFGKGIGYMNHFSKKRIYKAVFEDGWIPESVVWEGAITKLVVYIDPLSDIPKYEVVWESSIRPRPTKIGPVPLEELYQQLRSRGFASKLRLAEEALYNIVIEFMRKGLAEIRNEIDTQGFYVVDGRLVAVKYEVNAPSPGELREALLLLNELADKWYSHVRDRFSTIIKWGVIAPFIYARKQIGRQYQVPHLVLYGSRNAGKTTLAEIVLRIWGLDRAVHSYAGTQVNTEARLGDKISKSTFPIVVNEANIVFMRAELINMLKNSVEELVARGKMQGSQYQNILALSPIIFTMNPTPPVDFAGLALVPKTVYLIKFTTGERLREETIAEFRRSVEPRLPMLKALGQFVASVMLARPELLRTESWLELGRQLLEQAYKAAGLEPPAWLDLVYETETFDDIGAELVERIRQKLVEYINTQYSRLVGKGEIVDTVNRLTALLENKLIPFMFMDGDKVYITTGVLSALGLELESLRSLAEILGWRYIPRKPIRIGGRVTSISVIEVSKDELKNFLTPEIDQQAS